MDRRTFVASLIASSTASFTASPAFAATSPERDPFDVLVLGDSIAWGQGLVPDDRWRSIVERRIASALARPVFEIPTSVHSGAIIGIGDRGEIEERPREHLARQIYTPRYADATPESAERTETANFERSLLGTGGTGPASAYDGEVPSYTPTVLRQLDEFAGGSNVDRRIDLVLLSAGINDVSVTRLLNPLADRRYVREAIDAHCHHHLVVLLDRIRATIVERNPACVVVVLSYYPMIGPKSLAAPSTREIRAALTTPPSETRKESRARTIENTASFVTGNASPDDSDTAPDRVDRPQSGLVRALVAAAERFFSLSETAIGLAVDEANRAPFSPNFVHVTPGIDPDRTVFAKDAQLWGLRPNAFEAEDQVAGPRGEICRELGGKLGDLTADATRECFIASIGHPNAAGAERYADSIWTALQPRLSKP